MATGTVRMWNTQRSFGFIASDAGGRDIFVHIRQLKADVEALEVGQRVRFDEGTDPRTGKSEAQNVEII